MRIILPLLCLALAACATARRPVDAHPALEQPGNAVSGQPAEPVAFVMVRDSTNGAVLPRLAHVSGPAAQAVNRRLDSLSARFPCAGMPRSSRSRVQVAYAADSVFSVYVSAFPGCFHANTIPNVDLSLTFDLRTGRDVPFRELFAHYARDQGAIHRVIFGDLIARSRTLAAEARGTPEGGTITFEAYCAEFNTAAELTRRPLHYTFTDSGAVIEPEVSDARVQCNPRVVVPYSRLRRFAAPGGILARVADAHAARAARQRD